MVVAQYNAAELLSKRAEVSDRIREELIKRAQSFDLIFDDVAITHLNFGVEYMRAIESKQVAQQEAEKQLYVVEKAEQIRQATVIRAEGEAESANMITAAVEKHGEGILEMKRIDAAKQIAKTLSRSNKVTYLPSGGAGGGGGPGLLMSIDK
ncbi:hypothetical protein TeGR_g12211 [Tetraparma gracilis]|uniref:Prohibitin n=1 Tax=Tetraparma gracilis TaxID=2962635 RepID=A0ABQ6M917_9STRA|nr:hypothetical protein TeGR_g12211 [Tetraparma gracilis]